MTSEIRKELIEKFTKSGNKVSKTIEVRSLLQKRKGLWKKKQSLADFEEPVLFFVRRDGTIETHEKATAGKFVFTHSNGQERYIELRPSDQLTMPYGDKRVRTYFAHEDRPFSGWSNPIVDGESIMLGYEKTKATDLKYQKSLEEARAKGKLTIFWGIAIIIGALALATIVVPDTWWDKIFSGTKVILPLISP